MTTTQDILNHKLSEADRRIQTKIKEMQELLDSVERQVSNGRELWCHETLQVSANRLDQLLTERSTLRQVKADLSKVQEQQP